MIDICIYDYKKTDKIDIQCDDCKKIFQRPVHIYLKLHDKWECDLCMNCSITRTNKNKDKNKKCSITMKHKMKNMSNEERSKKYGNTSWMSNKSWLDQLKSKEGHGEKIKEVISKMTKEERSRKYGSKGENNPMYGKPPGKGSGVGYSGWYKDLFFRSKMELSFILNNIKTHQIESAESIFSIKYKVNEKNFTYRPDFLIDKNMVVEIKPSKLLEAENIKLKMDAAEKFFNDKKFNFIVLTEKDFPIISFEKLYEMYNNNEVDLTSFSKERLFKKYENKKY